MAVGLPALVTQHSVILYRCGLLLLAVHFLRHPLRKTWVIGDRRPMEQEATSMSSPFHISCNSGTLQRYPKQRPLKQHHPALLTTILPPNKSYVIMISCVMMVEVKRGPDHSTLIKVFSLQMAWGVHLILLSV